MARLSVLAIVPSDIIDTGYSTTTDRRAQRTSPNSQESEGRTLGCRILQWLHIMRRMCCLHELRPHKPEKGLLLTLLWPQSFAASVSRGPHPAHPVKPSTYTGQSVPNSRSRPPRRYPYPSPARVGSLWRSVLSTCGAGLFCSPEGRRSTYTKLQTCLCRMILFTKLAWVFKSRHVRDDSLKW